mmetsp:Transcript_25228/g.37687  ORF Transcript_25228/g.37687 Transcript_25228/m.37687 type:complete len:207 (+) Transcript_25228:220-840(+)
MGLARTKDRAKDTRHSFPCTMTLQPWKTITKGVPCDMLSLRSIQAVPLWFRPGSSIGPARAPMAKMKGNPVLPSPTLHLQIKCQTAQERSHQVRRRHMITRFFSLKFLRLLMVKLEVTPPLRQPLVMPPTDAIQIVKKEAPRGDVDLTIAHHPTNIFSLSEWRITSDFVVVLNTMMGPGQPIHDPHTQTMYLHRTCKNVLIVHHIV